MALSSRGVADEWLRRFAKDTRFEEAIKNQRFRHPDTGNQVLFVSLPPMEQARIRTRFMQQRQEEGDKKDESAAEPEDKKEKGPWSHRVLDAARRAVDWGTQAGKNLGRLVREPEDRAEVKKGLREKADDVKKKLRVELDESKEMLGTFARAMRGGELEKDELKKAVEQLKDVGKLAVLGSVTVAPLGPLDDVVLFLLTFGIKRVFPGFSWKPSAWRVEAADLAAHVADRLVEGMLEALENPSEHDVMTALEAMEQQRPSKKVAELWLTQVMFSR